MSEHDEDDEKLKSTAKKPTCILRGSKHVNDVNGFCRATCVVSRNPSVHPSG